MRGQLAKVKTKWIIAGLGLAIGGAWFSYDYSQCPTIRFVGYGPSDYPKEFPGNFPMFEIRNDTRHPFSLIQDGRAFRFLTDYGVREAWEESMNCTGRSIFTIDTGQSIRFAEHSHGGLGAQFAIGYRFYRGTKASLSAPRSTVAQFVSSVISRKFGPDSMKPRVTWSDFTGNP